MRRVLTVIVAALALLATAVVDPASAGQRQTLHELVSRASDLTQFERLLDAADLSSGLRRQARFTVFAPDDAAFDKAAAELGFADGPTLVTALIDSGVARNIVRYHIVSGARSAGWLTSGGGRVVTSNLGHDLRTTADGRVVDLHELTSDATLSGAHRRARDGILHTIDNLLAPGIDFGVSTTACQEIVLHDLQATRCEFEASTAFDPTPHVGPDRLMTIQAVGQAGQANQNQSAPGGEGGRAQTTLPADFFGADPLYLYVAQRDYSSLPLRWQGGGGGATSFVATQTYPFTVTSGQVPEQVVVAAGGGGGAGSNYNEAHGGNGGAAVASDATAYGGGQTGGARSPGGIPGTGARFTQQEWQGGTGFESSGSSTFGWQGGVGGGTCTGFPPDPSTVTAGTLPPIGQGSPGGGDDGSSDDPTTCDGGGGGGGAGTAGGGGGYYAESIDSGGGGGGGSQARDTAGTDVPAFAQQWIPTSDDSTPRVAITFYPVPTSPGADCFDAAAGGDPVVRCTITSSTLPVDLDQLIADVLGSQGLTTAARDVPVHLEAWGASGGRGGDVWTTDGFGNTANGGPGGDGGYGRTSQTAGALLDTAASLYVYVGANGANGPTNGGNDAPAQGTPGGGGASTLVLTTPLNTSTIVDDMMLDAGGGGGGGQGRVTWIGRNGRPGDDGSAAVAGVDGDVSPRPQSRLLGGAAGEGGCTRRASFRDRCGTDGIGGRGGSSGSGRAGWLGTDLSWSAGAGGNTRGGNLDGGAGGGGHGGGAAGPGGFFFSLPLRSAGGGGSGGSYAAASAIDVTDPPVVGQANPPSAATGGGVVMTFDFCAYDATLPICTDTTSP